MKKELDNLNNIIVNYFDNKFCVQRADIRLGKKYILLSRDNNDYVTFALTYLETVQFLRGMQFAQSEQFKQLINK